MKQLINFKKIWLIDFEFKMENGGIPEPVCLVAKEYFSKKVIKYRRAELLEMDSAPFEVSKDVLFVAYFLISEMLCFLKLGWLMPVFVLDFFIFYRNAINGRLRQERKGLVDALKFYGIDYLSQEEKDLMREFIINKPDFTEDDYKRITDYCEKDVIALELLMDNLKDKFENFGRYLFFSAYMKIAAKIEYSGIPVDIENYRLFLENQSKIKGFLMEELNKDIKIYENGIFKRNLFQEFLKKNKIPWVYSKGVPILDEKKVFKSKARLYKDVNKIYQVRKAISALCHNSLSIGEDGRNRSCISPFSSKTGRNQPSSARNIFLNPAWVRFFIKPSEGFAIAYNDYCQQEFAIAAKLSSDEKMMEAYLSGDPYTTFAKMAGALNENMSIEEQRRIRAIYKETALGILYGMGYKTLSLKLDISEAKAKSLIDNHKQTFKTFWKWLENVVSNSYFNGFIESGYGWRLLINSHSKEGTVKNYKMQSNGAEIIRLACMYAFDKDIKVCAVIHDALFIEAPVNEIENAVRITKKAMQAASIKILNGFEIRTDEKIFRYPERYFDERGEEIWKKVSTFLKFRL